MKQLHSFKMHIKLLAAAILSGLLLVAFVPGGSTAALAAGTPIGGGIGTPTTWTIAGSPYIVSGDVFVTAPLTIEQDVIVKLLPGSRLNVFTTIHTQGALGHPVYITSIKDDAVGGDTNGDGSASSPKAGDWQCICINGVGEFSHTVIRYAGEEIADGAGGWGGYKYESNRYYPTLYAAHGTRLSMDNVVLQHGSVGIHAMSWLQKTPQISITHSTIEGMSRAAIMAGMWIGFPPYDHIISITDSVLRDNGHGLLLERSTIDISGGSITGNEVGIEFRETSGRLYRNIIYNNGIGIVAHSEILMEQNSIFSNRDYGINAESMTTNLDARNTWWGHASGPHHASNPFGQGNAVTDHVNYWPVLDFPLRTDTNVLELPIGEELVVPVSPMINYYLKVRPEFGRNLIIRMDTQANVTVELFASPNRQP
ncbi:MAG: NosD domain-containing protein, partial [Caldilineaceae bacterium]